jgi:hypothetical protein
MLSIEECRKLIPHHEQYSDEQIIKINNDLRALAGIIFDKWLAERNGKKLPDHSNELAQ